ncbi:MW1434 family type I TA system toxin, partial [Enterococcus faecium]
MTFEEILPELKKGAKIIRKGWSGFELYVVL